ncbi:MAG: glycosyltransferase, partial [Zavarzinella sp.]|nr:glycosyltransferase [Zavarzinella sp.]
MVPSSFTRKFVIVLAVVVCIAYLAYRVNWTFNTSGPYAYTASLLLFVAECFGILNLFLFFLQVWDVSEPPARPVLEGRTVDVFVPTLDEDVALLRATLEACVRMDYPHKTYVLDDGRRPEVEKLARDLGIHYLARPDNRHFKAGNLNHAFERTDGEFVVVLDADHVPEPHFITRLIGYFADDRLGYVQTPHAFYNFDSFQARLDHASRKYWEEGHLFHHVIQPGRNRWGCPIFAGSAAMFRRSAIRDVGLMATETITEDLHTGLRMNARGWRSLAITERLVAGEAAPDITTYHAQRLRWGTGNLSVLRYDNPLTIGGLSVAQRVCYVGSMLHWATGLFKLVIYLTPIAMLFSGIPPVKEFTWELLWVTVVYLIVSLTAMKIVSNGYGSIVNAELFAMVNFWTQIRATFRALLGYGTRQFQVTPKGPAVRERRRVIWPFIRPQTYLIILSVLALFWGWSRPVLEVSDDWFTPVVPTVWVLFHFWLAYKVTQRAFWPADRRLTRRHVVHVPIEYETLAGGAPPRYGVTIDLNDQGMAFVAYEKFGPGDVLRFTVRGAGETVRCKGEIRSVTDLTRGEEADGFRYGILFLNATDPQMDALNRICLHYGVPRLYGEYDRRRGGLLGALQQHLDRGLAQRRRERRNRYRLPIVVNSGETEDTVQFSATEDLSRSAVAALLDHGLPKDTPVGYLLATPIGEVRGAARVLRTSPEVYAGRTYYRTVMEFADFEGQGRTTLNSLVNPHEAGPLRAALKPDRKPILVQMAGATFVAILIALPLIVLQSGIFRYYHQDDYVLRDIHAKAVRQEPLTPEDAAEVERVFRATMADRNPTSDRLVLLMNALKVYGRRQDQLTVAEELAGRNANDLGLQQALIYAQLRAGCYTDAEATFVRLQEQADSGRLDAEQTRQFRLAGARVAEGRGDLDRALERYRELYDENPDYIAATERPNGTPVRREFAGVLLKAGRFDEAKEVLQSARTDDLEAQRMRVAAHLLKGRAVATDPTVPDTRRKDDEAREYDGAERAVKDLADYADQKQDVALKDAAARMRADVYMARHSWTMAREIMDKMAAVHGGNDPDLVRRLAQAQLGLGDYAGALNGFATLLANDRVSGALKGDVIRGFLDAAAHPTVTPGDREREIALGKVFEGGLACIENDPIYLARFGWVLQRVRRPDESRQVLEKASQKHPSNPEVRNQLANILIQTGNDEQAAALLAESNPFRARQTKASSLMRRGDWTGAEAELRKAAAEFPAGFRNPDGYVVTADDVRRTELLLGTALGLEALQHQPDRPDAFPAAIAHYQGLQKKYPSDPEVTVALGNMYLWSAERTGDPAGRQEEYATALKQFHKVLADKTWTPDADGPVSRSKVEQGFIDAAASAPGLDPAEAVIAKAIAARRVN